MHAGTFWGRSCAAAVVCVLRGLPVLLGTSAAAACFLLPDTYAGTFWAARALPLSCACYVAFLYCFWRLGKNLALGGSLFSLGQVRGCRSALGPQQQQQQQ
jgi:hypothetical protein